MKKCPEYVRVEGKLYKIDTNFKTAIECNRIAEDPNIGDFERVLGIIYTLFGEEGLNNPEHYQRLLELAKTYLSCGKELDEKNDENPDMDYIQDYDLIWTSMYSDYNGLDIDKENINWWDFNKLMNGLSNSELGNCCVLNRVRNLRNLDLKNIKDKKERDRLAKAKQQVALKKTKKEVKMTKEQQESADEFNKMLGL